MGNMYSGESILNKAGENGITVVQLPCESVGVKLHVPLHEDLVSHAKFYCHISIVRFQV